LAEPKTLNQSAVKARVKGEVGQEDFDLIKEEIAKETEAIQIQINALDSEKSTMDELMQQAHVESVDLVAAWNNGDVNRRQELVKALFPEGLVFSHKRGFFEPANAVITEMLMRYLFDPVTLAPRRDLNPCYRP
jgi:hypothetical protein